MEENGKLIDDADQANDSIQCGTSATGIGYPPQNSIYGMSCRSIRFGSFRTLPTKLQSFHIGMTGLYFYVKSNDSENYSCGVRSSGNCRWPSNLNSLARPPIHGDLDKSSDDRQPASFNIHINWKHVEQIQYYFALNLSVVFIRLSPTACERLRSTFRFDVAPVENYVDFYLDSRSTQLCYKYVAVLINHQHSEEVQHAEQCIRKISGLNDLQHIQFVPLRYQDANGLLLKTLPPHLKHLIGVGGPVNRTATLSATLDSNKRSLDADPDCPLFQCENTALKCPRIQRNVAGTFTTVPIRLAHKGGTMSTNYPTVRLLSFNPTPVLRLSASSSPSPSSSDSPISVLTAKPKEPDDLFTYSSTSCGQIVIHENDLRCLQEGEFLNDTIINFYLDYLVHKLPRDERRRIHLFSTYFWTKLCRSLSKSNSATSAICGEANVDNCKYDFHAGVKRWTKNVDIFGKDFIIIPINEAAHWYLAIVCYPYLDGPVFAEVDTALKNGQNEASMAGPQHDSVEPNPLTKDPIGDTVIECGLIDDPSETVRDVDQQQQSTVIVNDPSDAPTPDASSPAKGPCLQDIKPCLQDIKPQPLKEPCIVVLDSLREGITPNYRTSKIIRDYLAAEWAFRKPDEPVREYPATSMKGIYPKPPQQDNYSDCGMFVLEYAERFLYNGLLADSAITSPKTPIGEGFWKIMPAGNSRDVSGWFAAERVKAKRNELKDLLLKSADEWKKVRTTDGTCNSTQSSVNHDEVIMVTE